MPNPGFKWNHFNLFIRGPNGLDYWTKNSVRQCRVWLHAVLACAESLISQISPRKRIFKWNHFNLYIRGPDGLEKNPKKSHDTATLTYHAPWATSGHKSHFVGLLPLYYMEPQENRNMCEYGKTILNLIFTSLRNVPKISMFSLIVLYKLIVQLTHTSC